MNFKRIELMTIAAGLAITSFNACSQDEDLEGYVLNEGNGVSTLAKRSMGRGGESAPGGSGGSQPANPSWSCIAEKDYDEMLSFLFEYHEWESHSLWNEYYGIISGVDLDIKAYRRQKVKDEEKDENNDQATYEYYATVNFDPYSSHERLRLTDIWSAPGFNRNKLSYIKSFLLLNT